MQTRMQVLKPYRGQPVPAHPREYHVDPLTQRRLRRETLGSCASGMLVVGQIVKSTGVDLFYRHQNGLKPPHGELSEALLGLVQQCWSTMSRKPGKPVYQRINNTGLYWLASLPLIGSYGIEQLLGGGCELYRLKPLVRRPKG